MEYCVTGRRGQTGHNDCRSSLSVNDVILRLHEYRVGVRLVNEIRAVVWTRFRRRTHVLGENMSPLCAPQIPSGIEPGTWRRETDYCHNTALRNCQTDECISLVHSRALSLVADGETASRVSKIAENSLTK